MKMRTGMNPRRGAGYRRVSICEVETDSQLVLQ